MCIGVCVWICMHVKYVLLVTNVGVGVQVGLEFSQLGLFDMSDDVIYMMIARYLMRWWMLVCSGIWWDDGHDGCWYVQVFDEMVYMMDAGISDEMMDMMDAGMFRYLMRWWTWWMLVCSGIWWDDGHDGCWYVQVCIICGRCLGGGRTVRWSAERILCLWRLSQVRLSAVWQPAWQSTAIA